MKKYKNLDYNTVKKLIEYSNTISIIYNELYIMDINRKKDTQTYFDYIGLISYVKKKEMQIYNNIPYDLLKEYFEYFQNLDELSSEIKSDVSRVLFNNSSSYITTRIVNILEYILEENDKFADEEFEEMSVNELYYLDDEEFEELFDFNEFIEKTNNLDDFQDEALNISIIFLNDLINKIKNDNLKKDLLKMKYINAFSNISIEDDYLSYKFDLDLSMLNISEYKKLFYVLDNAYNSSIIQIKELLKKENYSNQKNFIINLSLLKAYLYFLKDDNIVRLINKLYSSKNKNPDLKKVRTKIITEMKDVLNKVSN